MKVREGEKVRKNDLRTLIAVLEEN